MEKNNKDGQREAENEYKEFTDEVTKDKIHHHLLDINDTISEDDIKNIITDISSTKTLRNNKENFPLKEDEPQKKNDNTDQLPTPWNIVD